MVSVIQMNIFYGDLSNLNLELMSNETAKLTGVEKITSYFSLGSYFQAYPLCHNVQIETNSLQLECKGDMVVQEIYEANVFKHGTQLCTSDKEEFKERMKDDQFKTLAGAIDDHNDCNVDSFFKRQGFTKALNDECIGKHGCNFNGKLHDNYFIEESPCWGKRKEYDLVVQLKCGNPPEVIAKRNKTGVFCTCLGVLGNLLFIIGISYHLNRKNKIRTLKYAEYTVSSKNFSCELNFDDNQFDYLLYREEDEDGNPLPPDERWVQEDEKEFRDASEQYVPNSEHWTYVHAKPGHALQDEVQRVLEKELAKFYGLDASSPEEWKGTQGYQYFL